MMPRQRWRDDVRDEIVCAESRASRVALEDLSDDIRAQREGLLAVIDELRRRNGPSAPS